MTRMRRRNERSFLRVAGRRAFISATCGGVFEVSMKTKTTRLVCEGEATETYVFKQILLEYGKERSICGSKSITLDGSTEMLCLCGIDQGCVVIGKQRERKRDHWSWRTPSTMYVVAHAFAY